MNRTLSLILTMLTVTSVSCSTFQTPDEKHAQVKPVKSRHSSLPEGVISVDIVRWNQRLHLLTGHYHRGRKTLTYRFSDNGGKNWSEKRKILNLNDIAIKMVRGNDAQIAVQGNTIVVAWMQYIEEARFNAGPMLVARSTDEGRTWQYTATPPSWKQGPHGYIDMAADKHSIAAVWLDSRSRNKSTRPAQGLQYAYSEDGGLSWLEDKTLDEQTCSCCWNTIKSDGDGNTFVLYRDKHPSDMSIGRLTQDHHWQYLNHVGSFNWDFQGCPHIGGGLDFQKTSTTHRLHAVIGTGHPDHAGIHYLFSEDHGQSWSDAVSLGNESSMHGDIAAGDNGHIMAIWDMLGTNGMAVFLAESFDQGLNWSRPRQLSAPANRATHPRIIKTSSGFLALWTAHDGNQQRLITQAFPP